jgi:pilus assembly protein CpaB
MRKPANIFLIALLIAAVGAALVYRFLSMQQAELERARASSVGAVVDVAVAAVAIDIGTRLKPEHVRMVKWPTDAAPANSLSDPEALVGKIARVSIRHHQPFLVSDLTAETAGIMPLLIEDGMRAISVKVDKVTGVSGFITPSSRVDVLATGTIDGADGEREDRSRLILQNVRVMATGTHIEMTDGGSVEVPTVTLLVTPADAEKVALVARKEPVFLALRGFRDNQEVRTEGVLLKKLFVNGASAPSAAPALPPPPKVVGGPAPKKGPTVEILLGETRTRQAY